MLFDQPEQSNDQYVTRSETVGRVPNHVPWQEAPGEYVLVDLSAVVGYVGSGLLRAAGQDSQARI